MLERTVMARTEALERSADQLRLSREETIRRLSQAIEYRDEETSGHTERMSRYAAELGRRLGFDPEPIRIASPMHDVGKVALADRILLKPTALTPEERAEMQLHPEIGHKILYGSGSAMLDLAAKIAWTHHEKYDGTGYPRGLRGDEIPIEGQIAAVADVFDAITSERPYRAAFSVDDAVSMMRAESGKHFNPRLLEVFLSSMDEILEIKSRFT
jgi:putative two-component system response regulator